MKDNLKIATLAIGDELLDGRVKEGNSFHLSRELSSLGLELSSAHCVADQEEQIISTLKALIQTHDIVILSGGLGPTSDDITAQCIAKVVNEELIFHEDWYKHMEQLFKNRGIHPMPQNNKKQAYIAKHSTLLFNDLGTAPGTKTKIENCTIWSFPGVPKEYHHLTQKYLIPEILAIQKANNEPLLVRRTLQCLGKSESLIAQDLELIRQNNPDIRIQYQASLPEIKVRFIFLTQIEQLQQTNLRADNLLLTAKNAIGEAVWSLDEQPLHEKVIALAKQKNITIGLAESCTGGLVSKLLTDVTGSSDVFLGGIVCYTNQIKQNVLKVDQQILEKYSAVSKEVATSMVKGAYECLKSQITVSITGIAGPSGGTDLTPVGTVYFGIFYNGECQVIHKKFTNTDRERIRHTAAAFALKYILEKMS